MWFKHELLVLKHTVNHRVLALCESDLPSTLQWLQYLHMVSWLSLGTQRYDSVQWVPGIFVQNPLYI
jgi:hypothetical protein